jgi:hypothetical protein
MRIAQPNSYGCVNGLWIGPRFVVLEGYDEHQGRVVSVEPPSRRVTTLGHFNDYVVSPDRHWFAGEVGSPRTRLVAVVSLASGTCRVVAQPTSPNQEVSVDKSPWSIRPFPPTSPPTSAYKQLVIWRTVRRGGRKIRVVSGPGTGFTRNSRSLIIARWQQTKTPPYAIHKRLAKLELSSLHTPCPAGLVPHV